MGIFTYWFLLFGVPFLHPQSSSGLKFAVRHSHESIWSEQVEYRDQDRSRSEYRNLTGGSKRLLLLDLPLDVRYGPHLASIIRCDLGRTFELNLDASEYVEGPYPRQPLTKAQAEVLGLEPLQYVSDKPTLRIETTTVDTGERKDFFGHTARHVITTRKEIPLEGSKSDTQEMVTDGWYIDLDTSISCAWKRPSGKPVHVQAFLTATVYGKPVWNTPIEKMEFVDKGEPETGFAIEQKITSTGATTLPDGTKKEYYSSVNEMQVTQLVEAPLDPALFTVPTGFRHVKQIDRNPAPNSPNPWSIAWEDFKASVARLFR